MSTQSQTTDSLSPLQPILQDQALHAQTIARLEAAGAILLRPESSVFSPQVQIAAGAVIEPGVQLLGATRIGARSLVRSGCILENAIVGERVVLRNHCVISDSTIADAATIGPFAHLRPGSQVDAEAHVGNFVEMKKSRLGPGAKAGHLSYLGDATVGAGANIGAGVITCNYDGERKHPTAIGAGAFVGSDSTLVAPVSIGDGAYIGAGSCITREVPPDALAVGRSHQITKPEWAARRRQRLTKTC